MATFYVVRTKQRPWLLRFLGRYAYRIDKESMAYFALKPDGDWIPLVPLFNTIEEAKEVTDRHWAFTSSPWLVLIYGIFNRKLIRYRQQELASWGLSFWD